MRPADVFEPGYDTINFQSPDNNSPYKTKTPVQGGITMTYKEALAAAQAQK